VITLGARGAVACRGSEIIQAGTYSVQSIDESGAGDAFAAGFITGLLEDWPLEKTLSFRQCRRRLVHQRLGCTAGVFTFDEAMAFMARQPLKIERVRS
jgi:sugar/nucleoside kinase (ribokinase family)